MQIKTYRIGLTLFALDLYFAVPAEQARDASLALIGAAEFLQRPGSWRIILDVSMIGMFGGFYIVPLYALVQQRSEPSRRSRIIAGNNILNAFFMVLSATLAIVALDAGLSIPQLFLLIAVLNAVVAIYISTLVPEFLMRFIVWLLIHTIYRVDKKALENIPETGPAILVSNHISGLDPMLMVASSNRPLRFLIAREQYERFGLQWLFRAAGCIPVDRQRSPEKAMRAAFKALRNGEVVALFPHGKIHLDSDPPRKLKAGAARLSMHTGAPLVPMRITGVRRQGHVVSSVLLRSYARITPYPPILPAGKEPDELLEEIQKLIEPSINPHY